MNKQMNKKNLFQQTIAARFAVHKFLISKGFFESAHFLFKAMRQKDYKEIFAICKFWKDFANV